MLSFWIQFDLPCVWISHPMAADPALLLSSMALENNFMLEPIDAEYGGVVIDADRLPADKAGLARSLTASLSHWKSVVRLGPHF